MSNLTVDGDSDYSTAGTPDTFTAVSDGPSGTDALSAHINGVCRAVTELQTLLGNGLTLKGSVADLVTRLSRIVGADGAFNKGTAFPGTPIDGQPFYRTDLNTLYVYDAGSTSWSIGFDSGTFALVDGTREFTGDIKIEKSLPGVRLRGTEVSGTDLLVRENAGVLYFLKNTGTEDIPIWTEFFNINATTGALTTLLTQLTGSGAFRAIFSHANTGNRTYALPDYNWDFISGLLYKGPTSIGSGSTRSLETYTSATGNLSGIHFYDGNFTLNSGHTITVPAGKKRLIIIATGTITINGTINASGAGGAGGVIAASIVSALANPPGEHGTDQPGGGGGGENGTPTYGAYGGSVLCNGCVIQTGGAAGSGNGTAATQVTASDLGGILANPLLAMGGAGGGGSVGTAGGAGGGSIVLIAPTVILAATAILNTSGTTPNGATYGAGGGGAGNVYIRTRAYTDSGATFTQTAGGTDAGGTSNGGAGAAGIKQINIYA